MLYSITISFDVFVDMALHHFKFVDFVFGVGVPDGRSIFKCWSNIVIGLATVCFDWSGITFKNTQGAIGFLGDGIYVVVSGQFAIGIYA